jgi:hypothetical protein
MLQAPVFGLVLNAKVGQLQVSVDHLEVIRMGKCQAIVRHVGVGWPIRAIQEPLVVALDFIVEDDSGHAPTLASDLPGLFPEDGIQPGVVRELARLHGPGVEGLLAAFGSRGRVRVEEVFALSRETHNVVCAVSIRDRRLRHESCLAKVPPVAVKPIPALLVSLEVGGIDDAERTHRGKGPGLRSVERVGPASELDALALVAARQGQAVCEDVLVRLGPLSRYWSFDRSTAHARLANVRPVIVSAPSGHEGVGSAGYGTVRRR